MKIAIDINDVLRDYTRQFRLQYQKFIDPYFDISDEDINTLNFYEVFSFENEDAYKKFKYIDNAFEIFGRAEAVDKMLPYRFNDWVQNYMRDFDKEDMPEIMLVSPFEANMSIQATLLFLSTFGARVREIYFPVDSQTVWDRCDILITANPVYLENVPEGKFVIKINKPYNKETYNGGSGKLYEFNSMMEVINDKEEIIRKIIEKKDVDD
jgi:hypothetical protein